MKIQSKQEVWELAFKQFYNDNESGGSSRWLVAPNIVENFIKSLINVTNIKTLKETMDNTKLIELILELVKNKETIQKDTPFEVGKSYFIRTVTYHLTGKLVAIKGDFLMFDDAAWIADSGRFNDAMKKGIDKNENSEVEPWENQVGLNIHSIVDFCEYPYKLPTSQK